MQDFEGTGNVGFSQPGTMAGETDEVYGMCDGTVLHGRVWTVDKTADAWCRGAIGGREINELSFVH